MNNYTKLASLTIKDKVERKGKMDYLSWANAWHMLKTEHPNAQRKVYESDHTGLNFFTDGSTAYVKVGIIVNDLEHIDYLPVMDFRNKSVSLENVTSMDINKTIQRSTAKAIAMHGLGLSLWTGEDVPELTTTTKIQAKTPKTITLEVGDDNWLKVTKYISANKELGLAKIVSNLGTKYSIKASVKKEIEKAL
tara:strand:+ start:2130 stop:2708 length:579 start_codon:yes stop_codon:yes gene_type:complete